MLRWPDMRGPAMQRAFAGLCSSSGLVFVPIGDGLCLACAPG